jgi:transposase
MSKVSSYKIHVKGFDFLAAYKLESQGRVKIRLLALHHFQNGKTIVEVADIVLADAKTVLRWIQRFVDYDYEGLLEEEGRGRKPRLPPDQEERFKRALDEEQDRREGGSLDAQDIQKILLEQFDCTYSISGVYALLDRIGVVWITARSKHPKTDLEAIQAFKDAFPQQLAEIRKQQPSRSIEVWWQDEARVGQRGTLSRQWASKGTRPRVVRQQQFQSTYIFGAVCPERDKGCALIMPEANAGAMQMHLDEISKMVDSNSHAVIMMDRASWHTTEALTVPENISLMPLPSYSPELNPVEQFWQNLRRESLSNRSYKDYDDVVNSCAKAWNSFVDEEGRIRNLCSRAWAVTGH